MERPDSRQTNSLTLQCLTWLHRKYSPWRPPWLPASIHSSSVLHPIHRLGQYFNHNTTTCIEWVKRLGSGQVQANHKWQCVSINAHGVWIHTRAARQQQSWSSLGSPSTYYPNLKLLHFVCKAYSIAVNATWSIFKFRNYVDIILNPNGLNLFLPPSVVWRWGKYLSLLHYHLLSVLQCEAVLNWFYIKHFTCFCNIKSEEAWWRDKITDGTFTHLCDQSH